MLEKIWHLPEHEDIQIDEDHLLSMARRVFVVTLVTQDKEALPEDLDIILEQHSGTFIPAILPGISYSSSASNDNGIASAHFDDAASALRAVTHIQKSLSLSAADLKGSGAYGIAMIAVDTDPLNPQFAFRGRENGSISANGDSKEGYVCTCIYIQIHIISFVRLFCQIRTVPSTPPSC